MNRYKVAMAPHGDGDWVHIDDVARMRRALSTAVQQYGKPGGPWNVPRDPGGWICEAMTALGCDECEHYKDPTGLHARCCMAPAEVYKECPISYVGSKSEMAALLAKIGEGNADYLNGIQIYDDIEAVLGKKAGS